MKRREVIEPLQKKPDRPQLSFAVEPSLRERFRKAAGGHGGMTSALQRFVRLFVDNHGKVAVVPNEGHVPGIVVSLEQSLIDRLSAVASPMTAEHLLEEMARALALSSGDQVSVTVPRKMAAAVYAFVSFMAEPQTDSNRRVIQALLQDLFSRSELEEEES
ncbi:MAG TPA: hypothetical protein VMF91_06395 [Bryobacteraceae bacterium]|nr:hypothetical protein [Bryobacteraceae bacterium]